MNDRNRKEQERERKRVREKEIEDVSECHPRPIENDKNLITTI